MNQYKITLSGKEKNGAAEVFDVLVLSETAAEAKDRAIIMTNGKIISCIPNPSPMK